MTPVELALMIFGLMLLLMVVRVPIAAAMFVAGTVGFVVQSGFSPFINFINNLAFARLANYDLSVIPLIEACATPVVMASTSAGFFACVCARS